MWLWGLNTRYPTLQSLSLCPSLVVLAFVESPTLYPVTANVVSSCQEEIANYRSDLRHLSPRPLPAASHMCGICDGSAFDSAMEKGEPQLLDVVDTPVVPLHEPYITLMNLHRPVRVRDIIGVVTWS